MFEEFLKTWHDPHARHALLVHVPIALATLGVLPLTWLACSGFRNQSARWVCLTWFLIAAAGAFLASQAGENALPTLAVTGRALTPAEAQIAHDHEEVGEKVWMWLLATTVLVSATFIPRKSARWIAGVLALLVGLGSLGAVAYTAHLGGRLVYGHGLGVPTR